MRLFIAFVFVCASAALLVIGIVQDNDWMLLGATSLGVGFLAGRFTTPERSRQKRSRSEDPDATELIPSGPELPKPRFRSRSNEFCTWEEAVGTLNITDRQLKHLISESEIRAFREGGATKFKTEAVLQLYKELEYPGSSASRVLDDFETAEITASSSQETPRPRSRLGEFYTWDEALVIVGPRGITAKTLKRLVVEGEVPAFREGDEMKFKKSTIDALGSSAL